MTLNSETVLDLLSLILGCYLKTMNEKLELPLYHIRLEGQLDPHWSEWLGSMTIIPLEDGTTLLSGSVADQTALHGLLAKIRDMNLTLVSVSKAS